MATEEKQKNNRGAGIQAKDIAVILEFEHIVLSSRAAMYGILKESLSSYNKEMTVPLFSRFCIYEGPTEFIPKLASELDISTRSVDKLINEVEDGMNAYWKSDSKEFRPGLKSLIESAKAKGLPQIALTALPEKLATQALQGLGEICDSLEIHSFADQGKTVAGADIWVRAAVDQSLNPGHCIGLMSSSISCRAALSADLHCVAVLDEFTNYQDFGGASLICDSLEDLNLDELIERFHQDS